MQKKLIALAIAGLSSTAFAQSNVTISGVLKGGYDSTKISGGTAATGSMSQISDQASNIIFKGTESLGNGLSAIFQIDARFGIDGYDNNTTSTVSGNNVSGFATGNTHVGLKSASFGEFKLGTQDLHYNETERIEAGAKSLSQQALVGRSILSQVRTSATAVDTVAPNATRAKNVAFWDSPNWSGFTVRAAYSTSDKGDELTSTTISGQEGSAYNLVGRYENGPIKAGISYYDRDDSAAAGAVQPGGKSTKAWAGYTIAGFSFGLAYDQSKQENLGAVAGAYAKRNAWAIPLSYAFGNHGIYATYAEADDAKTQAGDVASSGAKQYTLGYSYDFSKRTSVGVNYTKISNDANAAYTFGNIKSAGPSTGQDISQFYAGIRHAF